MNTTYHEEWKRQHAKTTEALDLLDKEVESISTELEDLNKRESTLNARKLELQGKRIILAARVAPIARIEPELLAHIFEFVLAGRKVSDIYKLSEGPLNRIGLVSKNWRTVALGWPSLWREVGIDYADHERSMSSVRRAKVYIERSGGCMLKFALRIHASFYKPANDSSPTREAILKQILDKIALPVGRCEDISLDCKSEDMSVAVEWLQNELVLATERTKQTPALKIFRLSGGASFHNLGPFPGILRLSVDNTVLTSWTTPTSPIPTSLRRLELTNVTSIPFKSFMKWLDGSKLETLSLIDCGWPPNEATLLIEEPPCSLLELRSLKLFFSDDRNTQAVIESVYAPNLAELQLKGGYIPRIDIEQGYGGPRLPISGPSSVTTLQLREFDITSLEMRDFFVLLKVFPQLKRLEMVKMTIDTGLFDVWRKVVHSKVCPLLEEISFEEKSSLSNTNISDFEGQELLIKFAESKRIAENGVMPLSRLELHGLHLADVIVDRLTTLGVKVIP